MSTVIVINSYGMGNGSKELGEVLIGAFLKKIWARTAKPETIVLYNEGVRLIAEGLPYLDALDGLESQGVEIVACGTCLDFYEIENSIKVGRRSDMNEIVNFMMEADKVITI